MADKIKPRRRAEFRKQFANTERQWANAAAHDNVIKCPEQSANDNSLTWPLIPDGWPSGAGGGIKPMSPLCCGLFGVAL